MSRTFFTQVAAEEFATHMKQVGYERVEIWGGLDGFRQRIYTVKWYY